MNKIITLITLLSFFSSTCFAEEDIFSHLDYPELQVAPRASERLTQLAALEDSNGLLLEWTMLTSGAMTLIAGLKHRGNYRSSDPSEQEKTDSDMAANAGIIVGAGWITLGSIMTYKHWANARLGEVKRIPAKDKRGELARERMAEEALEYSANTTATLENISIFTNFATGLYITGYATNSNRVYSLLAMTTSFLPLLFPNVYRLSYEKHLEYKRKIYAPLVGVAFNEKMDPMMNWTWNF